MPLRGGGRAPAPYLKPEPAPNLPQFTLTLAIALTLRNNFDEKFPRLCFRILDGLTLSNSPRKTTIQHSRISPRVFWRNHSDIYC